MPRSWLTISCVNPLAARSSSSSSQNRCSPLKIHPGRGLVEHEQFRFLLQGKRQQDALHFAAGQIAKPPGSEVFRLTIERSSSECAFSEGRMPSQSGRFWMPMTRNSTTVSGIPRSIADALRHIAEPQGFSACPVMTSMSLSWRHLADEGEDERGLARAVGAHDDGVQPAGPWR